MPTDAVTGRGITHPESEGHRGPREEGVQMPESAAENRTKGVNRPREGGGK